MNLEIVVRSYSSDDLDNIKRILPDYSRFPDAMVSKEAYPKFRTFNFPDYRRFRRIEYTDETTFIFCESVETARILSEDS